MDNRVNRKPGDGGGVDKILRAIKKPFSSVTAAELNITLHYYTSSACTS